MRLAVVCARRSLATPRSPSSLPTPVTIEPIVGVVKTTTNKKFQRKNYVASNTASRRQAEASGRQEGRGVRQRGVQAGSMAVGLPHAVAIS